jgi:hypothetical protein
MRRLIPLFLLMILSACAPQNSPAEDVDKQMVQVYADVFGEAWLPDLYTCAERSPELLVSRTPNVDAANIIVGLNATLSADVAAYQIGELEFVFAGNSQNPLLALSLSDTQNIYRGKTYNWAQLGWDDATLHLWVYDPRGGFRADFLGMGTPTSLAKQAQNPGAMRSAILNDIYAVGFLPREFVKDDLTVLFYQDFMIPVLILLPEENNALKSIVECLQ